MALSRSVVENVEVAHVVKSWNVHGVTGVVVGVKSAAHAAGPVRPPGVAGVTIVACSDTTVDPSVKVTVKVGAWLARFCGQFEKSA
jgi:hypothetical protein